MAHSANGISRYSEKGERNKQCRIILRLQKRMYRESSGNEKPHDVSSKSVRKERPAR